MEQRSQHNRKYAPHLPAPSADYVFERLTTAAVRLVRGVAWAVQQGTRRVLMAAFLCCWLSVVLQLALLFYAGRAWLHVVGACAKLALAVAVGLPSTTASGAAALLATLSFGVHLPLRTLNRVAAIMR